MGQEGGSIFSDPSYFCGMRARTTSLFLKAAAVASPFGLLHNGQSHVVRSLCGAGASHNFTSKPAMIYVK